MTGTKHVCSGRVRHARCWWMALRCCLPGVAADMNAGHRNRRGHAALSTNCIRCMRIRRSRAAQWATAPPDPDGSQGAARRQHGPTEQEVLRRAPATAVHRLHNPAAVDARRRTARRELDPRARFIRDRPGTIGRPRRRRQRRSQTLTRGWWPRGAGARLVTSTMRATPGFFVGGLLCCGALRPGLRPPSSHRSLRLEPLGCAGRDRGAGCRPPGQDVPY